MPDRDLASDVMAALERDPRIDLHTARVQAVVNGDVVSLEGDVEELAAKRLLARVAAEVNGVRAVVDRVGVRAVEPMTDAQIRDHLRRALLSENAFVRHALRHEEANGTVQTLRDPDDPGGEIVYGVDDGGVRLRGHVWSHSHRRLAEALAWWIPGTRNVLNELSVVPEEADTDAELADAVRLVFEKDHLLSSDQLTVRAEDARVVLSGAIPNPEQRRLAEHDAWCVAGVRDVDNRLVTP